jgi:predicted AlkP superfamily phosphohydrolase/phosphomutase
MNALTVLGYLSQLIWRLQVFFPGRLFFIHWPPWPNLESFHFHGLCNFSNYFSECDFKVSETWDCLGIKKCEMMVVQDWDFFSNRAPP